MIYMSDKYFRKYQKYKNKYLNLLESINRDWNTDTNKLNAKHNDCSLYEFESDKEGTG